MRSLQNLQNYGRDSSADMRPGVAEQFLSILEGLMLGAAAGLFYDLIRLIQRKVLTGWRRVLDIVYTAAAGAAVCTAGMLTESGGCIWQFCGMLAGFFLYLYIISRFSCPLIAGIFCSVKDMLLKIFKFFMKIVVSAKNIFKKM